MGVCNLSYFFSRWAIYAHTHSTSTLCHHGSETGFPSILLKHRGRVIWRKVTARYQEPIEIDASGLQGYWICLNVILRFQHKNSGNILPHPKLSAIWSSYIVSVQHNNKPKFIYLLPRPYVPVFMCPQWPHHYIYVHTLCHWRTRYIWTCHQRLAWTECSDLVLTCTPYPYKTA